jgi:hypothetical protein
MQESQLKSQIVDYSVKNAYHAEHFAIAQCAGCGCRIFTLLMNEEEGVAARICTACSEEHGIGDSDDYIDEVDEVSPIECTCGADRFEIMAGVALYADSEDVRWFYLGCECVECGLSGVYGDWKNEFIGYQALLDRV